MLILLYEITRKFITFIKNSKFLVCNDEDHYKGLGRCVGCKYDEFFEMFKLKFRNGLKKSYVYSNYDLKTLIDRSTRIDMLDYYTNAYLIEETMYGIKIKVLKLETDGNEITTKKKHTIETMICSYCGSVILSKRKRCPFCRTSTSENLYSDNSKDVENSISYALERGFRNLSRRINE